jgi:predicted ATPase/DNA-binding CsgD family transcriptional regulator
VVTEAAVREGGGLPHEVTSFVGRRQATTDVKHALSDSRMVTLTGFGGIGKSRLALHVAHELRRAFPDGAYLVELANLRDPSLVPQVVASALGLHDRSIRTPETVLLDYLADKHLLLLLDNCEHLVDSCSRLTARLLAAAPRLRVLATSREPLNIAGERTWPVPPLSVPAVSVLDSPGSLPENTLRHHGALALFEDRAAAALPEFVVNQGNLAAVARLCQRLDGIPLAIELAAVRVRMLSVEEILARLEDRFRLLTGGDRSEAQRHKALRAAVDWSFNLCSEHEQQLWARCSVFADEFDLDAAENICAGDGMTTDDVFTCIVGLIDKSVLTRTGDSPQTRYRMLETIRQYGQERLAEAGMDAAVRRRHRDYYLRLAEQSDAESAGPDQTSWITRLRTERPNFRTAMDYCLTTPGEARTGLRLASALWFCWAACGLVREGRTWLERALALDTDPSSDRAHALWITGWIAHLQGDRLASLARLNESRDLARRLGDDDALTYALQFLGDREAWENNLTCAVPLLDEALARHRASNQWTAAALFIFGIQAQTAGLLGEVDRALAFLHECETITIPLGERWVRSWAQWDVAIAWWAANDPDTAASFATDSLRKKRELNDLLGIIDCVEVLAWVAAASGDAQRAAILFGALEEMWQLIGTPLFGSHILVSWSRQARSRARHALGDAAFESASCQGARMNRQQIISYALDEKPPAASTAAAPASQVEQTLTKREREVAALIAAGKPNKEIAADLVISQRTAEAHIEHILTKLSFTSRTQVATWITQNRRT